MNFQKPITSRSEAIRFIVDLHDQNMLFHFDDDPSQIVDASSGAPLFNPQDIEPLRDRVDELFMLIDPFEIAIALTGD